MSSTAASPTGTLTRNTARQLVNSTRTPPSTCPATNPTDAVAPYRPSARVRCGPSAKPVVMRDSAAGATSAAPAPCTARAATSSTGSWASPPARDAAEKAIRPGHEHPAAAEQVGGPAAEDQQPAERDRVPGHHPLRRRGREAQLALDGGQRHVHDAEIQHDHERGDQDEGQRGAADGGGGGEGLAWGRALLRWVRDGWKVR